MTLCRLRAARTSESKSPSKIPSVHASYVAAPAKGVNTTTARRRRTLSLRLACILPRILDNWGASQDKVEKIFTYSSPYSPQWASTRSRSFLGGTERAGNLCFSFASTTFVEEGMICGSGGSVSDVYTCTV